MRHKNSDNTNDAENELEKRVDRMMDPRQPEDGRDEVSRSEAGGGGDTQAAGTPPPIDIFKDPTTAPDVPREVLDEVGLGDNKDDKQEKSDEGETKPDKTPADGKTEEAGVPEVSASGEPFNDSKTDAAVEDITKRESDKLLEVDDAISAEAAAVPKAQNAGGHHFGGIFKKWWVWLIIMLAIVGALYAVPFTRYHLAGLLVKQSYTVTVLDSTTHTAVSGATVTLDGKIVTTDARGNAAFDVPVGHRQLNVHEKYYKDYSGDVLVPLWSTGKQTVQLVAIGRQVPVKVVNKITGQPVADATVRVLDTKATTGKDGTATIVLPVSATIQPGKVQADGYNTADVTVQVTAKTIPANTFEITPNGRMYFLSNLSGNIDVTSSNLDGSARQTILAGTGSEDAENTVLMASRDWKYLALLSKRDGGGTAKLFLIDTTHNNKVTTIDDSNADFLPIGWKDHYFMYKVSRPSVPAWQSGSTSLQSFNADTGKDITLANSSATGTSNANAAYEAIWNALILGGKLVYATTWYTYPGYIGAGSQQSTLVSINPDGTDETVVSKLDASKAYFVDLYKDSPQEAIAQVSSIGTSGAPAYYKLEADGTYAQTTDSKLTNTPVTQYPTYLLSPGGTKSFWTEERDGKNMLFVGDNNAQNAKTAASLSTDYMAYGWYTDNYLLVSYKGSELDILPASGLKDGQQPLKITNYYKPNYGLNGYGYGGGL